MDGRSCENSTNLARLRGHGALNQGTQSHGPYKGLGPAGSTHSKLLTSSVHTHTHYVSLYYMYIYMYVYICIHGYILFWLLM